MNMISTGAFLPETDASTKQNELVKKLTAAWEKKNSKTARAGGASLMALSLAACGGEDNTPFSAADVSAAETAAAASATTAALTGADGTVYASVDAAVTSNDTAIADAAAAAVDITTDNQALIDAAVAAVDLTTDNAAATDAAVAAASSFASLADLVAAYDALVAPAGNNQALTTDDDVVFGTSSADALTATSSTYETADVVADSTAGDGDTLTVTASADITATPTVSGIETVTFNLDAAAAGTDNEFDVNVQNVNADTIVLAATRATTTVTAAAATNVGTGTTIQSDLTLSVAADANADITIDMTKATTQTLTAQTGTADDVTVNSVAASGLTVADMDAEENITINNTAGGVTVTNLSAASDINATLTVSAAGAVAINNSDNRGTIDVTTTTGNITIGDDAAGAGVNDVDFNGAASLTTGNGNITVTDLGAVAAAVTLSASGDGNGNATGADGDITLTDAGAATSITATASGGIAISDIDTATALDVTFGEASSVATAANVQDLTIATTGSSAANSTLSITAGEFRELDTITFAGAGDSIVSMAAADVDAAESSTANGTSASKLIMSDTGSGTSTFSFSTDLAALAIDASAYDIDVINLGATSNMSGSLTLASGANVTYGADQTNVVLTAAAVPGNSATVTINDDSSAAGDGNAWQGGILSATNIKTLTLVQNDTEQASSFSTIGVGTGNTLKIEGAGAVTVTTSITANNVDGSASTGALTIEMANVDTTFVTGSGNDTFVINTNDDHTIDGGAGIDTLLLDGTVGAGALALDLSAETFNMTNVEKVDMTKTANVTLTVSGAQVTGQALTFVGDSAANDTIAVNASSGTGETIDMSGSATVLAGMTVTGGAGTDNLTGMSGSATSLVGAGGADTLTGGSGADTFTGGAGNDTINLGGGGSDTIIFTDVDATANGSDTINDFAVGTTASGGDVLDTSAGVGDWGALTLANSVDGTSIVLASATALATQGTTIAVADNKAYFIKVDALSNYDTAAELVQALIDGGALDAVDVATSADAMLVLGEDNGSQLLVYGIDEGGDGAVGASEVALLATINSSADVIDSFTTANIA